MNYKIVPQENEALHKKARLVKSEEIGGAYLSKLIADMKTILSSERLGVAIAAPQVGEDVALFVVSGKVFDAREGKERDDETPPENPDQVFINPGIIKYSKKKQDMHEGCLTLPGLWGMVPRAERVRMRYIDENGEEKERGASGLLGHVFQHEVDHLDGILYTEKAHDMYEDGDDPKDYGA